MTAQERFMLFRSAALESLRVAENLEKAGEVEAMRIFVRIAKIERDETRKALDAMRREVNASNHEEASK